MTKNERKNLHRKDVRRYDKLCDNKRKYCKVDENGKAHYFVFCLECVTYHPEEEFLENSNSATGREIRCKKHSKTIEHRKASGRPKKGTVYLNNKPIDKDEIVNPRACEKARELLKRAESLERESKIVRVNKRSQGQKRDPFFKVPVTCFADILPDERGEGVTYYG